MKIVWLSHRDVEHPRGGGAERTSDEILSGLARRGHDVTLLSVRTEGADAVSVRRGYRIIRSRGTVSSHLASLRYVGGTTGADVVVEDLAHVVPWAVSLLTSKPGIAYFRHLHARTLPGQIAPVAARVLSFVESRYGSLYKRFPFVTESTTSVDDLAALGIRREHCHIIPPGVDGSRFTPRTKTAGPTISYFGGFRRYKRADHAVRTLYELRRRGLPVTMTMLGDGPTLSDTIEFVRSLALEDHVRFLGRVSDEVLAEVVGASWINLHCSVAEGWCLSAMEAAACGTPTVAYAVPGLIDSVSEGSSGTLVRDGQIESLTYAAEFYITHPNAEMSERCRAWAESFTWARTVDAWEVLLANVCRNG